MTFNKKYIFIGLVVLAIAILIAGIVSLLPGKNTPTNQNATTTRQDSPESANTSNPLENSTSQNVSDPLGIVQLVTTYIGAGQMEKAVPYFNLDPQTGYTKEQVLKLLIADKETLSESSGYHPAISLQNVQVFNSLAQVIVDYNKNGKIFTARYDLREDKTGWKITEVTYNEPLNLASIVNAQSVLTKSELNYPYNEQPVTITLPNGDVVVAQKTLLQAKKDSDYVFIFNNPKSSYVMAIYDHARPIYLENITKGETDKNAIHSFDTSDLADSGGGLVIIYPQGTIIDQQKEQIVPNGLVTIPIKVIK